MWDQITEIDGDHLHLVRILPATNIWREVTNSRKIERLIINRNKHRLQQVSTEEGCIHHVIIQQLMVNHGTLGTEVKNNKLIVYYCTPDNADSLTHKTNTIIQYIFQEVIFYLFITDLST